MSDDIVRGGNLDGKHVLFQIVALQHRADRYVVRALATRCNAGSGEILFSKTGLGAKVAHVDSSEKLAEGGSQARYNCLGHDQAFGRTVRAVASFMTCCEEVAGQGARELADLKLRGPCGVAVTDHAAPCEVCPLAGWLHSGTIQHARLPVCRRRHDFFRASASNIACPTSNLGDISEGTVGPCARLSARGAR
jgi:hypothetical protein